MADISSPRPIDAVTAPRSEAKAAYATPQAPAQAAKRRRLSRRWLMRGIVAVLMLIPVVAIVVAFVIVRGMHQPQALHRTHITPVTPQAPAAATKAKN